MRKTRIGALIASTTLASSVVLGGAAAANASVEGLISSVDVFGSLQEEELEEAPVEREEVDSAEIVGVSAGDDPQPRYTMTATAYNDCTVDFTLSDDWENYPVENRLPNFRADYRVGDEAPVMPGGSREGPTWRPVLGSNQGIEDAINGRDNPYDFGTNETTVDLTEPRIVPAYEDASETTVRPGVEPNEDGTHVVTFGVYQGPDTAAHGYYSFDTTVTVQGCPTLEGDTEDDQDSDNGSLGSLTGIS